jgi:hypothetical protein
MIITATHILLVGLSLMQTFIGSLKHIMFLIKKKFNTNNFVLFLKS